MGASDPTFLLQFLPPDTQAALAADNAQAQKNLLGDTDLVLLYEEIVERLVATLAFRFEPTREDTRIFLDGLTAELQKALRELASERAADIRARLDSQTVQLKIFLSELRLRYRLDLQHLRENLAPAGKNAWQSLQAVLVSRFPKESHARDYQTQRQQFAAFLRRAEAAFSAAAANGEFCLMLESFRNAARLYELAKDFGRGLERRPAVQAIGPFLPAVGDSAGVRLVRATNSLEARQVAAARQDDLLLAYADADDFYARCARQEREKTLPRELRVVDVSAGSAKFAADFLDRILLLDLESQAAGGPSIGLYDRIRWEIWECTAKAEAELRNLRALMKHERRIHWHPDRAADQTPIAYLRSRGYFSTLPDILPLYVNRAGKPFVFEGRLAIPDQTIIRTPDYGAGEFSRFQRALGARSPEAAGFHPETLAAVRLERRLRTVTWSQLPYGDLLREMVGNWREVFIPVSLGVLDFLERVRRRMLKPGGLIRIFDTGFPVLSPELHQSYYFAAQLGLAGTGNRPALLSFPALGLWGRKNHFRSIIRSQESWIRRVSGKAVFDPLPFLPRLSGRKLIRQVSRPGAPLGPQYWLNPQSPAAQRAYDLDFLIGGILQQLLQGEAVDWLPTDYEPFRRALTQLGYDAERVFADLFDNPYYAQLFIFELSACS